MEVQVYSLGVEVTLSTLYLLRQSQATFKGTNISSTSRVALCGTVSGD